MENQEVEERGDSVLAKEGEKEVDKKVKERNKVKD